MSIANWYTSVFGKTNVRQRWVLILGRKQTADGATIEMLPMCYILVRGVYAFSLASLVLP